MRKTAATPRRPAPATPTADPLNLDLVLARLAESDDLLVRAWAEALRDRGEAGEDRRPGDG
jgi:hypothetical protein